MKTQYKKFKILVEITAFVVTLLAYCTFWDKTNKS